MTPETLKNMFSWNFSQMCSESIWEGPWRLKASKTMTLRQFQLPENEKTQNMKINIEFDPGRSQERRKQCAFDFQCVFVSFVGFISYGAKHSPSTLATPDWGAEGRRFRRFTQIQNGTTRANLTPSIDKSNENRRQSIYVWNTLFLIREESFNVKLEEYLMYILKILFKHLPKMTPETS